MNKALLSLLLAVCVLGMALIMLNERLSGDTPPIQTKTSTELLPAPKEVDENPVATRGETTQHTIPLTPTAPKNAETREPQPKYIPPSRLAADTQAAPKKPEKKPESPRSQTKPLTDERAVSELRPIARTEQDIRRSEKEKESARKPQPQSQASVSAQTTETAEKPMDVTPEKTQASEPKKPADKTSANEPKNSADKTQVSDPKMPSEKAEKPAESKKVIKKFVIFARDKGATIRLTGNSALTYKSSQMHNPERLLIELDGNWDVAAPKIPKNVFVSNIRIGKKDNKTRVVLDLKSQPKSARVIQNKDKQNIDVRVDE